MSIWITTGAIAVPFLIMAALFLKGKGAFLIAGYNTMSEEKQATYDEKALCRSVGRFLLVLTTLMFLFPLAVYIEFIWFFYIVVLLFLALPIGYAIYASTGNRFRKIIDPDSQVAKDAFKPMSKGKRGAIIIGLIFAILIFVVIGVLIYQG